MAMQQIHTELLRALKLGQDNQNKTIDELDRIIRKNGTNSVDKWRNNDDAKRNPLLHELIERKWTKVLVQLLEKHELDVSVRGGLDGLTPLQLATELRDPAMCEALKKAGAIEVATEDVSKWLSEEEKEKSLNIVWVDLEMTSLEDPEIIECAVIITDKYLSTLARGSWVIHFDQSVLTTLGTWHQNTFKDIEDGGNGLFADSIKSKWTKEEVEKALLDLLKVHCVEKQNSLAGSSIHIDKEVLKKCMPKVHDFLHYRIIDVSSFQAIMKRWAPRMESKMKRDLAANGQETVNHRAMDDIEWSISLMKQFKPLLEEKPPRKHHNENHRPYQNNGASSTPDRRHPPMNRQNSNSSSSQLYADERRVLERIQLEQTFDVEKLHLQKEYEEIYKANPHLHEVFMNGEKPQRYRDSFTIVNRILKVGFEPAGNNRFDSRKFNTTEHWGQRKLLLTEIEFLTNYGLDDHCLVIYVGAASCVYMEYLSLLFPDLRFLLFDTKPISTRPTSRIDIRQEPFSEQLAEKYYNEKKKILFICNVRTFGESHNQDLLLMQDMQNQKKWCKLLQPQASLLNFRPIPGDQPMKYFQGDLIIEPWASKRSNECRLVVTKNSKSTNYDTQKFLNSLQYFHHVDRIRYYENDMDSIDTEGLDHCYDCRAEIFILHQYVTQVKRYPSNMDVRKEIGKMSHEISTKIEDRTRPQFLALPRTLDIADNLTAIL